jgi:gamma-glutamyltranspeptidase/glutathione hydrolase
MTDVFPTDRTTWIPGRLPARGRGGMVAAKNPHAAEAGVAILRAGGNAIDAAVATAFAIGVVEPWMNGIGGGGYLVAWLEGEQRAVSVDYPMLSPAGATEDMFPLVPGATADAALFGWPQVQGGENVLGYRSVAVPGTVAGLALALEQFGTKSLGEVMQPAITLAENGVPVDWHTTYWIGRDQANLSRFPGTAEMFLVNRGAAPVSDTQANPAIVRYPDLARTLRGIADHGPGWFYGEVGTTIATHLADQGAPFTPDDFSAYRARVSEAMATPYRDATVLAAPGASGGVTLSQMILMMDRLDLSTETVGDPESLHLLIQAFRQAFADRFAYLADPDQVEVPFEALLDPAYAEECVARVTRDAYAGPVAGTRERLGVSHGLAPSVPEYVRDGSTTHLSTVDAAGNAVSLTQTLLSGWGSRVVVPGTGVLLNNGMMWFDPEPGRPNSVGGRKRMLSNMAPAVVRHGDGTITSLGSSGGRKIMICNAQLIRNVIDFGLDPQAALDEPRIDTSTRETIVPDSLPIATRERLATLGHAVAVRKQAVMAGEWASPVAVTRFVDGSYAGGADAFYYPATAIAAEPQVD